MNGYLDEAITWRDVGFQWNWARQQSTVNGQQSAAVSTPGRKRSGPKSWQEDGELPAFNFDTFDFSPLSERGTLAGVLPEWALASLTKHAADKRSHLYSLDQFEAATTHEVHHHRGGVASEHNCRADEGELKLQQGTDAECDFTERH